MGRDRLTIQLDDTLKEAIQKACSMKGRTLTGFVTDAILIYAGSVSESCEENLEKLHRQKKAGIEGLDEIIKFYENEMEVYQEIMMYSKFEVDDDQDGESKSGFSHVKKEKDGKVKKVNLKKKGENK